MSQARDAAVARAAREKLAELESLGFYHSIELPDGTVFKGFQSLDALRTRLSQFPIPADLRGKRVLDVGAWDGWFAFEMERRGAQVVALDLVKSENFLRIRDLLKSGVEYVIGDISRLSSKDLGRFDIVLFLGVLYHLKHPLLALENVCDLTLEMACVESFVTDRGENLDAPPVIEFYEGTELQGQFDNWVGPNVPCLLAMARVAGFAEVKLESVLRDRAHVTCLRKWSSQPQGAAAPTLLCVENATSRDHCFSVAKDDYVSLWFESPRAGLDCNNVYIEVGPFGARPAKVLNTGGNGWHAVCKLPPGLAAGWQGVRIRVADSRFSNVARIPVDLIPHPPGQSGPYSQAINIQLVTDGKTWERSRLKVGDGGGLSIWASGIPESYQSHDVEVILGTMVLPTAFLSATDEKGLRQVNAMVPAGIDRGSAKVQLSCLGEISEPFDISLW